MNTSVAANGESLPALPASTEMVPSWQATMDSYRRGLEPRTLDAAYELAETLAKTKMCKIASPEDALARILTGRELGLTAMQSIRGVYMVDGRPGLDASLMQGLCLQSALCEEFYCIEDTDTRVTYRVKRRGRPARNITWTIEDARRAQLLDRGEDPSKNNWNKYPRQMLHARCKAEGSRAEFPERMFGLLSREEMMDGIIDVTASAVDASLGTPDEARDADQLSPMARLKSELLARIDAAKTGEQRKQVRAAITTAEESGSLAGPALGDVKEKYNERFAKKSDSLSANLREPGEEG